MWNIFKDKFIDWSSTKNEELMKKHGLMFEEVLQAIEDERIIDITEHPNKKKYPHQYILIVEIDDYVCVVPFVVDDEKIFLKTIYKSRKLKKYYEK